MAAAPWPGDAPGGIVWSVGQDGPGLFGYHGGGHADPYAGNAIMDNFGVFEGDTFYSAGGRTDLTGLEPGGTPEFYGEPGGVGYRKGRSFVAFLPVNQGATTFDASLRAQSDGRFAYDHVAPGDGQQRYGFDGVGLPDGLDCFSLGLHPRTEPLDPTPTGFDIELSLAGTDAFLAELQSGSSSSLLQGLDPHWSFPGGMTAFATATATVEPNPVLEGAFLDTLGLNATPIFDPALAGIAFGDPSCGRRMTGIGVCDQGLDQHFQEILDTTVVVREFDFDYPGGSNGCAWFLGGAPEPLAALSVGSRPFSADDLLFQRQSHPSCQSADLDLGEEAFLLFCGGGEDPMALIWRTFFEDGGETLPYRVQLELLDPSAFPNIPETIDSILAAEEAGDLSPFEDLSRGLGPFEPTIFIPPLE